MAIFTWNIVHYYNTKNRSFAFFIMIYTHHHRGQMTSCPNQSRNSKFTNLKITECSVVWQKVLDHLQNCKKHLFVVPDCIFCMTFKFVNVKTKLPHLFCYNLRRWYMQWNHMAMNGDDMCIITIITSYDFELSNSIFCMSNELSWI